MAGTRSGTDRWGEAPDQRFWRCEENSLASIADAGLDAQSFFVGHSAVVREAIRVLGVRIGCGQVSADGAFLVQGQTGGGHHDNGDPAAPGVEQGRSNCDGALSTTRGEVDHDGGGVGGAQHGPDRLTLAGRRVAGKGGTEHVRQEGVSTPTVVGAALGGRRGGVEKVSSVGPRRLPRSRSDHEATRSGLHRATSVLPVSNRRPLWTGRHGQVLIDAATATFASENLSDQGGEIARADRLWVFVESVERVNGPLIGRLESECRLWQFRPSLQRVCNKSESVDFTHRCPRGNPGPSGRAGTRITTPTASRRTRGMRIPSASA